jgi:hypothetical protein
MMRRETAAQAIGSHETAAHVLSQVNTAGGSSANSSGSGCSTIDQMTIR